MAKALNVAEYILSKYGKMSAWKLQKLVYYSQAWNLVWDDVPLFDDEIQAWANGPVVRSLYACHRGQFIVTTVDGDKNKLSTAEKETIDLVYGHYGDKTAKYLRDLTHLEEPWIVAREGVPDGVRSENEITQASMHEYYSAI